VRGIDVVRKGGPSLTNWGRRTGSTVYKANGYRESSSLQVRETRRGRVKGGGKVKGGHHPECFNSEV